MGRKYFHLLHFFLKTLETWRKWGIPRGKNPSVRRPNFVLHRNKITWENAFKSTAYLGNVNTK